MTGFHTEADVHSWGGVLRGAQRVAVPLWTDDLPGLLDEGRGTGMSMLAGGLRRSYGDSGLNPQGGLIDMTGLDRAISFDPATRILWAEAGISFDAIIRLMAPRGLFLPVTPGTRFVTLGGAIANDVHGKNHHRNGTLGRWVRRLRLLRSSGEEIELTPQDTGGVFAATVGGLGLTGIITHAAIELVSIPSLAIDSETIPFASLGDFFALARESAEGYEHTVAWFDCLAKGSSLGRGLFIRGNHAAEAGLDLPAGRASLSVPAPLPAITLNRHSVAAFNAAYYRWKRRQRGMRRVALASFFYPLDGVSHWNRVYGRRGLYQYQAVVPPAQQEPAVAEMLRTISDSGQGSFLAVLKTFGALPSPGMLSFPREGTTLALDFPNAGAETMSLMARLDEIVVAAGGRLYPAKDGRMPAHMLRSGYPRLEEFRRHVDPGLNSAFWHRVAHG